MSTFLQVCSQYIIPRLARGNPAPLVLPRHPTDWLKFRHYRNLYQTEGRLRRMLGEFRVGRMDASVAQARTGAAELEASDLARAA